MKFLPRTLASLATLIFVNGCASLTSGTRQAILVNSTPPGATVTIGMQTEQTPAAIWVEKGEDHVVEVENGGETRFIPLRRRLDPRTFLNFIPPLWPGFIVDAVTGAITHFDPETIRVDFEEAS